MALLENLVQHALIFFSPIQFNRCMVGYVNASLSVFRVSDFEERSQPRTTGAQLLGEDVNYCRYWGSAIWILNPLDLHIDVYAGGVLGKPSVMLKQTGQIFLLLFWPVQSSSLGKRKLYVRTDVVTVTEITHWL